MESWIGKHESNPNVLMRHAIALARQGEGWCHPNPMVGAVIVKDGVVIGEGYHHRCGDLHAEREAIKSLIAPADGADLYVTLEPCCHTGRQPPCTDAIIEHHIHRVIIGSRDPNPKVHGKGAKILKDHGIEVVEDFLRGECDALNPVFFYYITHKLPYIRLKWAMTLDGKIATRTGASKWITGEEARGQVQRLRHASMGILAGIGTVMADDPLLTCRIENGRNPLRIICDSHLRIPLESKLVRTVKDVPLLVACTEETEKAKALREAGAEVLVCPEKNKEVDLSFLFQTLGDREIDSVLVEGGGSLNESALKTGLVNEIDAFIAPKIFGGRAKSPVEGEGIKEVDEAYHFRLDRVQAYGEDLCLTYRKEEPCSQD